MALPDPEPRLPEFARRVLAGEDGVDRKLDRAEETLRGINDGNVDPIRARAEDEATNWSDDFEELQNAIGRALYAIAEARYLIQTWSDQ